MYTNGLKDRFGSPLASNRDVEKQITGQIYNKVEHESLSLTNASNEAEVNCIAIKSAYLQHNKEFTEFSILPKDSNTDTPLYMYALLEQNQAKTVIGLSDEAITWEAGKEAVWKFTQNPITIPDGKNIELFMITGQSAIPASGDPTPPGRHIKIHCNSNMSNAGSTRYNTGWTMNRLVYCKFIEKLGQLVTKTHADETYLTEESANGIYLLQSDESVVKNNLIRESYDLEYCPDTAEVNGISLSSLYIPHNRTINKVSVLAKDMNLDTPLYLYVYTVKNGAKTRVGLSDAAILWTTDELVTWTFNQNPITIPDGANIEMYLVENEEAAAGLNEPNYPSRHIKIACKNNETNAGGTRYWDKWSMNRVVYCFFTDTDYKYIESETVKDTYLTKTEAHLKFATKEETKPYDWTPDWVHAIHSTNTADYTAPTNGWISTTDLTNSGTVTINGNLAGYNNNSYTMLLREGDQIHFDNGANFLFAPCNAEQEDWREVKTNYDIWKNAICYDDNGTPYVQNLYVPSAASWAENVRIPHNLTITKVEDEKAYNGENFVCNIQSTEIENATFLFYGFNVNGVDTVCPIQTWDSDLNRLLSGGYMFCRSDLNSFSGNLDSMTRGYQMFYNSKLASFSTPMPKVVNGYLMFATTSLNNFNVEELPNLSNGEAMFAYTNISSFTTDMPKLSNAREMFMSTPSLTTFDADLSNLKTGWKMFGDGDSALSKLTAQSVENIASSIQDINGMARNDDSLWKYDTVDTYGTVKPDAGTIGYDYRGVLHLTCETGIENSASSALESIIGKGWTLYVNGNIYEGNSFTIYDVSEQNGYAPIADKWNDEIYKQNNFDIRVAEPVENKDYGRVVDGYGSDLFYIEGDKLTSASGLMQDTPINGWYIDMPNLVTAHYMFMGSNLSNFESNTPMLYDASHMFYGIPNDTRIKINTDNLEIADYMFYGCQIAKIIDSNKTSDKFDKVTCAYYMFASSYCMMASMSYDSGYIPVQNYYSFASLKNAAGMYAEAEFAEGAENVIIPQNLDKAPSMFYATNATKAGALDSYTKVVGITSCTDFSCAFSKCADLSSAYINLSNLCNCSEMFKHDSSLRNVAIPFNKISNGHEMFAYTYFASYGLVDVDTDGTLLGDVCHSPNHFSSLRDASRMFFGCSGLGRFKKVSDTSDFPIHIGDCGIYTDCSDMFGYTSWESGQGEDTISIAGHYITNASQMFRNSSMNSGVVHITDLGIEKYIQTNGTTGANCRQMFYGTSGLKVNVSLNYVTNASQMFSYANVYEFSNGMIFDGVSKYLQDAAYMFEQCGADNSEVGNQIKTLFQNWNPETSISPELSGMFRNCYAVTSVPLNIEQSLCDRENISINEIFAKTVYMRGDVTTGMKYIDCYCANMFSGSAIDTVTDFGIANPEKNLSITASYMFDTCLNLSSATFKGNGVSGASCMFRDCANLSSFGVERTWQNIDNAYYMFSGCNLNGDSVRNILTVMLPEVTNNYIDMTLSENGCDVLMEILNPSEAITIPKYNADSTRETNSYVYNSWKGWQLRITCKSGNYEYQPVSHLSIVEGSKYIPNADTWNEDFTAAAQTNDKLVVTSVHDGYAWNDNIG